MEEERVLLTVWDDAGQEPEAVADVELRPARAAVAAVAQRARRHRAVALPAGHRAAYGVCRTHAYRQGQGKGSRGREGALSSSSSSLTDDGGEDGGERGEEVGGGHGAEGQERHRHDDRGRGRGGAGNPCSASSRREHLGRSGSRHRSLDLARLSWSWTGSLDWAPLRAWGRGRGRLCSFRSSSLSFGCVLSGREGKGRGRLAGAARPCVGELLFLALAPPWIDSAAEAR